jgi:dipeptidyl-peptidase-3
MALKQDYRLGLIVLVVVAVGFCRAADEGRTPKAKPVETRERRYLLDRAGDVGFLQLYIDGFETLPLEQKLLAYHLAEAARAGKPIAFDQVHRRGLEIKNLLEQIMTHAQGVDVEAAKKMRDYFLQFSANGGNYYSHNHDKFVPAFTFEELRDAARIAQRGGAFPGADAIALDAQLEDLRRTIFDPAYEPVLFTTKPNQDNVAGTAVNFYRDVTQAEAEANDKDKPYPIVNRLVKVNGVIREEVYRAGDPARGIPPGRYAKELGEVVGHLNDALPHAATAKQKEAFQRLISFFKSGDPVDFREYNRAWVHDNSSVDAILGFIETYGEPMGRRASFEGIISFKDPKFTKVIQLVADESGYFEKAAPWPDAYKKKTVVPITANAVTVFVNAGDAANKLTLGVNLPNEQALRETEGSKNIMIGNALESVSAYQGAKEMEEFSWDKREVELYRKWGDAAYRLHVSLHETAGHASGRMSERLKGHEPAEFLKEYAGALEEARAELFGLWAIADPKLKEKGLVASPEIIEESYRSFITKGGLVQLKGYAKADRLTQAHARARNLITMYLLNKTGAVEVKERDSKVFLHVTDIGKMRGGVSELLGELMRVKAEGDYDAAKKLFETYGDPINIAWRDQVVARHKALGLPTRLVPVNANLEPVRDASGAITDVAVRYPATIEEALLGKLAKRLPAAALMP